MAPYINGRLWAESGTASSYYPGLPYPVRLARTDAVEIQSRELGTNPHRRRLIASVRIGCIGPHNLPDLARDAADGRANGGPFPGARLVDPSRRHLSDADGRS